MFARRVQGRQYCVKCGGDVGLINDARLQPDVRFLCSNCHIAMETANGCNMKRFVVYSEEHGYFKPNKSRSLWYDESDFFVTVEQAALYTSETTARDRAIALMSGRNKILSFVLPVEVTFEFKRETTTGLTDILSEQLAECQEIMTKVDALSNQEVEKLSKVKWEEYKKAKQFVQVFDKATI